MISVIIPTYNERNVLTDCIKSIEEQSSRDFEVIVVDDGSTDDISDISRNLRTKYENLKYFRQKHSGAGEARNLGAKHAKGNVFVFVDADMTFDRNFLKNLVKPISDGRAEGTFSKEEFVSNWDNIWARCWNLNEGWEPKRRHVKNHPDKQPVFRAILSREFNSVGGFTPGGYDDDWSLSKKLGYLAVNAPGAIFYHKNPASLTEVFNHARWVGKRRYKFGYVGNFVALARSSLPCSLVIGVFRSITSLKPEFLIFKLVYDLGIFTGIMSFMLTGKSSK